MSSKNSNGTFRRDSGYGGRSLASTVHNAMMDGSFTMLNHNRSSETRGSNGDLVIRAGISSSSPATRRRGVRGAPGNTASVTQIINSRDDEPMETISSTLMRPTGDQARVRPNYSGEPSSCGEVLGSVTIGEVEPEGEPGYGGNIPHRPCVTPQRPCVTPQRPCVTPQRPCVTPQRPIEPPQKFQIFVRNLDGKHSTFRVFGTDRVEHLMELIREKISIPPEQQRLVYAGKHLERGMTLQHYRIEAESTIFLEGRLRGG